MSRRARVLLALVLVLTCAGCAPAFHLPHERMKQNCYMYTDSAECRESRGRWHYLQAWGYSTTLPELGESRSYFGSYFGGVRNIPPGHGRERCQAARTNFLTLEARSGRQALAGECRPLTMTLGGSLWAVSLSNSDDGIVMSSQAACEVVRGSPVWMPGYLRSACTPVSVR